MANRSPQAPEAEAALLSAMIVDPEAAREARDLVVADDFYRSAHRTLFGALVAILERGEAPDPALVLDELRSRAALSEAGGQQYLAKLVDAVATTANVEAHARTIREKAVRRRLIEVAEETAREAREGGGEPVVDLLDRAEHRILSVGQERAGPDGFSTGRELGAAFFDEVEEAREHGDTVTGLRTGFTDLDGLTNGFGPGELPVLAGRPGMGKTALALDLARHTAIREGEGVAIYSLEMRGTEVVGRALCAEARLPFQRVRKGQLSDREASDLLTARGRIAEAPFFVKDPTGLTVHELRSSARRLHERQGLGLVVIDYLQLMRGPASAGNREQEVASISRSLKELALELDVPVLALSQLSRAPENRSGSNRPRLTDLRESGAIEQDADLVMFLYREELELDPTHPRYSDVEGKAELIVAKQRNGPLGSVSLHFRKGPITFDSFSGRPDAEGVAA